MVSYFLWFHIIIVYKLFILFNLTNFIIIRVFIILSSYCTNLFSNFFFKFNYFDFNILLLKSLSEFLIIFSFVILISDITSMLMNFECVIVSFSLIFFIIFQYFFHSIRNIFIIIKIFQIFFVLALLPLL